MSWRAFIPHPCPNCTTELPLAQCGMSTWENTWLSGGRRPLAASLRPTRGESRRRGACRTGLQVSAAGYPGEAAARGQSAVSRKGPPLRPPDASSLVASQPPPRCADDMTAEGYRQGTPRGAAEGCPMSERGPRAQGDAAAVYCIRRTDEPKPVLSNWSREASGRPGQPHGRPARVSLSPRGLILVLDCTASPPCKFRQHRLPKERVIFVGHVTRPTRV
jgi:hypothetical protein